MISRQTSEATTKTASTRSKPWREVNDEVAARMIAASSDSPPLIPKRDYEHNSPRRSMTMARQNQRTIGSYNTTSECSSTDDCKNLVEQASKETCTNAQERQQIALYRQHPPTNHLAAPFFYPPIGAGYQGQSFVDSQFLSSQDIHSPAFNHVPPMPVFPSECPFPIGYMDSLPQPGPPHFFPPPPFLAAPPFMAPPFPPAPLNVEMLAHDAERRGKKNRRQRSRSLEHSFFPPPPPPFFGGPPGRNILAPPSFLPPVPSMVPPHPIGRPTMLAIEANQTDQSQGHPFGCTSQPSAGDPFGLLPPLRMGYKGETLKNGFTSKCGMAEAEGEDFYPTKLTQEKSESEVNWSACCKGFSQILWIIITIILIGVILGLVLGLTLV